MAIKATLCKAMLCGPALAVAWRLPAARRGRRQAS